MTTIEKLQQIYGERVSLKELIRHEDFMTRIPESYLPEFIQNDFIRTTAVSYTSEDEQVFCKFVILDESGQFVSDIKNDICQFPDSGILIRFDIPQKTKIPEAITVAYIINLSSIEYTITSEFDTSIVENVNTVIMSEWLLFNNLDFNEYSNSFIECKRVIDEMLSDKKALFDMLYD